MMIDKNDPILTAFVLGELSPEEMAEVQRQVQEDPELQAEVQAISQVCGNLTTAFTKLAPKNDSLRLSDSQRQEVLRHATKGIDGSVGGALGLGEKEQAPNEGDIPEHVKVSKEPPLDSGGSFKRRVLPWLVLGASSLVVLVLVCLPAVQSARTAGTVSDSSKHEASKQYNASPRSGGDFRPGGQLGGKNSGIGGAGGGIDFEAKGFFEYQGLGVDQLEGKDFGGADGKRNGWTFHTENGVTVSDRAFAYDKLLARSGKSLELWKREESLGYIPSSGLNLNRQNVDKLNDPSLVPIANDRSVLKPRHSSSAGSRDKDKITNQINNLKNGSKVGGNSAGGRDPKKKSWKRVKATANATRLVIGSKQELRPSGMQVDVQIDGFRARVVVDYLFYNPHPQQLEGQFKMRLPNGCSPYYFAFGESRYHFVPDLKNEGEQIARNFITGSRGQLVNLSPERIRSTRKDAWSNVKEARMVPKAKAAFAYKEVTRRRIDPAIVEWAGAGVFDAKVFPLSPNKMHRIVMGYDVDLRREKDHWVLDLNLPEDSGQCQFDCRVTTTDDVSVVPKMEVDKFENTAMFHQEKAKAGRYQIKVPAQQGLVLYSSGKSSDPQTKDEQNLTKKSSQGDYFATSVVLPLKSEDQSASRRAIFLLDTSLSSQPEKFNVWLSLLDSILENNEDSLHEFALMNFDVQQRWWKKHYVKNTKENREKLQDYCQDLSLEGATDLESAFRFMAENLSAWNDGKSEVGSSRPDVFLLSDGAATWGQKSVRMMKMRLDQGGLGRLFAYQASMQGTAIGSLRFLAGSRGGAVFSIPNEQEIVTASRAHRKSPWKLVGISSDGASDLMTSGRIQWVYPGQAMMVVGRGKPEGSLRFELEKGDVKKTFNVKLLQKERSQLAFRTYGQIAVGQLENLGYLVEKFSTAYARNFRITGQTCSLLMLESEADYKRFKINPENDLFVVGSKDCSEIVKETLANREKALSDSKAAIWHFLGQLSDAGGSQFKRTTDLELVWPFVGQVPNSKSLSVENFRLGSKEDSIREILAAGKLDYRKVSDSAKELQAGGKNADAIRRLSCLVERDSGNVDLVRDVAFSVMELGRADLAFHLLLDLANRRPFDGSLYLDMAECLNQMGNPSMALVMNDVAVRGRFSKAGFGPISSIRFRETAANLKSQKENQELKKVWQYAKSRLIALEKQAPFGKADVVVMMGWNTDRTDVDLHVIDPTGEECFYQHRKTKMGGRITSDVTDGYGPEMFWLKEAEPGVYQVKVKYFSSDNLRKGLDSKVYLKVYRKFGSKDQTISRKTVTLRKNSQVQTVLQFRIKDN